MWFEKLTGFPETSPSFVKENLIKEDEYFTSRANGRRFKHGNLEVISLDALRLRNAPDTIPSGNLKVEEVVADVMQLHTLAENEHALFQAASQFNLLEMVSPNVSPEQGIDGYSYDKTQGPACAIACGAGTIYRNYFIPLDNQLGQTTEHQIDCLDELGMALGNEDSNLWKMKNGYALATHDGLQKINSVLNDCNLKERETLQGKIKVGIQWDTEVTIGNSPHEVSQIYCSALPVAYSPIAAEHWEAFARLILEATYEASFYAAIENYKKYGVNILYLTLVGGGAFGNKTSWILDALQKSLLKFCKTPLQIKIVSYGHSHPELRDWLENINN